MCTRAAAVKRDIWHNRLGHANEETIGPKNRDILVKGMNSASENNCEQCIEEKICRKTHPRINERRNKRIMELWHIDLIGPIRPKTYGGRRYIFTMADDFSRMIFIKLLDRKSEAAEELKKIVTLKEINQKESNRETFEEIQIGQWRRISRGRSKKVV